MLRWGGEDSSNFHRGPSSPDSPPYTRAFVFTQQIQSRDFLPPGESASAAETGNKLVLPLLTVTIILQLPPPDADESAGAAETGRSVVVFEEVDVLLEEDKGFVGALVHLLQSSQVPIQSVSIVLRMCC